ncbi:tail fiber domain-containing protein, partial [Pseudomonadota bacterium]
LCTYYTPDQQGEEFVVAVIRFIIPFICAVVLLAGPVFQSVQAEVPTKMSYTGRLTDSGGAPLTGTYDVTFKLYTVATMGTAVWTETQTGVSVSGGVFTVELGSVTPLDPADFSEPLYLGVTIGTDDEMSPRLPVSSAGYAFKPASYAKVAIVAKGGGDYMSPLDAMANVSSGDAWCGTPSATNRCLVQIMPGVYDIGSTGITMQQWVSIRGSGEETTKVTGAVSTGNINTSAVVRGADDVDLSDLTIENTGGAGNSIGVRNRSASPTMTHVTATATGGTLRNYGVYNDAASPTLSSMKADASGGSTNIGVWNTNAASPTMTHVTATGSGGTNSYGVGNDDSSPTMDNVVATGSGGTNSYGVRNLFFSSPTMNNVLADNGSTRTLHFDTANVSIDVTTVSLATTNMTVQSTNGMGLNEATPLAGGGLHITAQDRSLPSSALENDDLIVEADDSVLGLYSIDGGNWGSAVALGEISGGDGTLVNKWGMVRRTSTATFPNYLYFTFGTNKNYASNAMSVMFTPSGAAFKGNNLTTWETTSDAAVKEEIAPIVGALDRLMQVRPVTFRYTDEYRAAHPSLGDGRHYSVIAQEFAEVFPDAVSESGERLENEDRALYQVNIHPALITAMAAIQELNEKLEAENERIKTENAELNRKYAEMQIATADILSRLERLETAQ